MELAILANIAAFLAAPLVFWAGIVLFAVLLVVATESESLGGAFFCTLFGGSLGVIHYGTFAAFFAAVKANPALIIGGIVLSFVVGTLWARYMWGRFVTKKADEINEYIEENGADKAYLRFANQSAFTVEQIKASNFACLAPQVRQYKKKITTWIILWLPSMAFYMLNDPIRRIANAIFDFIKKSFQEASDRIFKNAFRVQAPAPAEEVKEDELH